MEAGSGRRRTPSGRPSWERVKRARELACCYRTQGAAHAVPMFLTSVRLRRFVPGLLACGGLGGLSAASSLALCTPLICMVKGRMYMRVYGTHARAPTE